MLFPALGYLCVLLFKNCIHIMSFALLTCNSLGPREWEDGLVEVQPLDLSCIYGKIAFPFPRKLMFACLLYLCST